MTKFLILFCLTITGCVSEKYTIRYGNHVIITAGFYTGCTGVAEEYRSYYKTWPWKEAAIRVDFYLGNCSNVGREDILISHLKVVK